MMDPEKRSGCDTLNFHEYESHQFLRHIVSEDQNRIEGIEVRIGEILAGEMGPFDPSRRRPERIEIPTTR